MTTLTIKGSKESDLRIIHELAQRLGLETNVEPNISPNTPGGHLTNSTDKQLVEMGIASTGSAAKDFLLEETDKMF
jgi:hypothetical protein